MSITKITTHIVDGLKRRIEQYKNKPNIEGTLTSFIKQVQDLEDAGDEMFLERMLADAVGEQLDQFGKIVVLARQGFDDDFYRVLLFVKIGQNVSNGEPERIISTMKTLAQADLVFYQNLGNGQIGLGVDVDLDFDLIDFIYNNMQRVVMAGVRINFITCFDPDEPFSFDGTGPVGLGFSSTAAPLTGGKFAFIHRRTTPFAFAGDDNALGFGTIGDVLAGGVFVGL